VEEVHLLAALLGTEEFAGAAELQIAFGDAEAVVGLLENGEAIARAILLEFGVVADARGVKQETLGLPFAPTDASSKLVKRGEAESVGVLDDDDARVRDVNTDFNHRGGHQSLSLTLTKLIERVSLLISTELPM
jgi:hypothetical protein